AKFFKVRKPAEVLIFADCGVRPHAGTNPLDYCDALYYTTNYMMNQSGIPTGDLGKLSGVAKVPWLKDRIPLERHGKKTNNQGRIHGRFLAAPRRARVPPNLQTGADPPSPAVFDFPAAQAAESS